MLRTRFSSRGEGEGDVEGPIRWNHDLLLEHSVEPVGRHTALALSQSLGGGRNTNRINMMDDPDRPTTSWNLQPAGCLVLYGKDYDNSGHTMKCSGLEVNKLLYMMEVLKSGRIAVVLWIHPSIRWKRFRRT